MVQLNEMRRTRTINSRGRCKMRNALTLLVMLVCAIPCMAGQIQRPVVQQMDLIPLAFTENHGQWDDRVQFKANAGGATMWFTTDGIYYQFTRRISVAPDDPRGRQTSPSAPSDSIEQLVIKASFIGANPNPEIVGNDVMEYKCNYFIGNDPDEWHTDVPNYKAIVFNDVYAGIDLKYYGNGKQMEYDFIVSPGADPNQIMVQYDGAKSISVNDNGELVVETEWGNVTELRPLIYQFDANGCMPIQGQYVLFTDNTFGFDLGDRYDPTLALVIDPVLSYSTYLGGNGNDEGWGIAVDGSGSAYVTGLTYSTDFPTVDPYQTDEGSWDVYITKLSSSGNSVAYSTYLGGGGVDKGYGIVVDASGAVYVTGETSSTDFPTANPYQTDMGENYQDVFVTKLSSSGNSLVYSTYLGGDGEEKGYAIAADSSGAVYVTGWTGSSDFPTLNPYQTYDGNDDVFITKLSSSGNSLVYSTYLGGSSIYEVAYGIAVDGSGAAYVAGYTQSTDFPTLNAYQGTYQGGYLDVFVTKLSSSGSSLVYSTYLGGSDNDYGYDLAVDGSGAVYVTGSTVSDDFPTLNPYQTYQGGDAFVTKLTSSGSSLVYSTYLGGGYWDEGWGIAVDGSGAAYVTGYTGSTDFPILNPYQGTFQGGEYDAFVTRLSSSGNSLDYSTYLGGSGKDQAHGIALDGSGGVYIVGMTESSNFPTLDQYQIDQGYQDAFVTKIGDFDVAADEVASDGIVPNGFSLYQNYPNPFNPSTTIEFYLDRASDVELHIFNTLGQEVRTIDLGRLSNGTHSTTWDGRDNSGQRLSSGMYFYRIKAGTLIETKKMIMLK